MADELFADASLPFAPGPLADAWQEGRRDAQRASRVSVVLNDRPEGYYHCQPGSF